MKKLTSALMMLTALTPLVLIPGLNDPTNLPKLAWIFLVTALLLGYNIREKLFKDGSVFIIPVLLILFWNLVAMHKTVNVYTGVHSILVLILLATFYITFENLMARDTGQAYGFIGKVLVVSAIVSAYGLLQQAGWDLLHWELKRSPLSTLGRRNFAAEYLVMVIPYACFAAAAAKRGKERALKILLLVLLASHLVFTFTRASYIAFFFSVLFFIIFIPGRKRLPGLKPAVILLILLALAGPLFSSSTAFQRGTVKSRLLIWNITLKMIKHNPFFGVGPGNFTILYPYYAIDEEQALRGKSLNVGNAHNDYLETAAETGIPGLAFFLFLLFASAKTAFILYKRAGEREKLLIAGIGASTIAVCINALASFPFKNASTSLIFWANLALLGAMYRRDKVIKQNVPVRAVQVYLAIFILTGLVFSYSGTAASRNMFKAKNSRGIHSLRFAEDSVKYNPFSFQYAHYAGTLALNAGDYRKAYDYLMQARRLHPYYDSIHNNMGMVYMLGGNPDAAEESFTNALRLNPESPEFNNNLGFLYVNTESYDEAIKCFEKAVESKQDFYLAWFSMGLAYYLKNDHSRAEKFFRKALELNPDFQPARDYLHKLPATSFLPLEGGG
ncbi:MAG: tetratricopeptide repeat protein [Candidatus Omnitrophica bacterium]|nr:tetratricopeptide repeat protein [Candidatus Omnitrophota bacterium]